MFRWTKLEASPHHRTSFSTHSVAPAAVLALSRDLFGAEPEAWLMGIRGYRFDEFGEELSPGAQRNLLAAIDFLRGFCRDDLSVPPHRVHSPVDSGNCTMKS